MSSSESYSSLASLVPLAHANGIRRIQVLAYRDLDDHAAGGSELHAHEVLRRWAAAGLDIQVRTVAVPGAEREAERDGYRITRAGGRSLGVPAIAAAGAFRRLGEFDALVEIWNGIPFFGPLWWRGPRLVVLHHLHDKLWEAFYPPPIDRIGSLVERKIAPLAYRSSTVATLAPSGRTDLINRTPLRANRVHVVRPGISDQFRVESPDHDRSPTPLLLAVGRLTSAKQFDKAIRAFHAVSDNHPNASLTIVGEGPERPALTELISQLGLEGRVTLVGRVPDDELRRLYQQAWLLLATSLSEGWGMTLTEAAAAGTPAVASDIIGHRDAMGEGAGVLTSTDVAFETAVRKLLDDPAELATCSKAAFASSHDLSWDRTAASLLQLLVTNSLDA